MNQLQGVLLTLMAAVLWGTVGISVNVLVLHTDLTAENVAFLRLIFAAPMLLLFSGGRPLRQGFPVCGVVLLGLGHAVYCYGYFRAIPLTGISIAVTVSLCLPPLLLALHQAFFKRQGLQMGLWMSVLLGVVGTVLVAHVPGAQVNLQGLLLSVMAAVGFLLVLQGSKMISDQQPQSMLLALGFLAGGLFLLPYMPEVQILKTLNLLAWSHLLYLALIPSALAYILFQKGLKRVSSLTAGLITLFEPLVSMVLAVVVFQEHLQVQQWLGVFCMVLMLVVIPKGKQAV